MIRLDRIPPWMIRTILQATQNFDPAEKFQEGAILRGTVVRTIGDKSFLIRLGGLDLIGFSTQELKPGETITVRVDQLRPQFSVTLFQDAAGVDEKTAGLLRLLFPAKQEIGGLLQRLVALLSGVQKGKLGESIGQNLKTVLEGMVLRLFGKVDAEAVRTFFQNSGLFYESSLARFLVEGGTDKDLKKIVQSDLKGQLMKLQEKIDQEIQRAISQGGPVPENAKALSRGIQSFLQNIELNQLLNSLAKKEGGYLLYQFPFSEGETPKSLRVYLKEEGGGKGKSAHAESKSHSVTLMLELTALGPVRADLQLKHPAVSGTISFLSEGAHSLAEAQLPDLLSALKNLGYTANLITGRGTEDFLTERLEEGKPDRGRGIVNVTA